jgi:signal peptidase I
MMRFLKPRPTDPAAAASTWETVKTVFYAIVLALLIRSFLFEPFSIPSTSMLPGLKVGDYIVVSKYSYGYSRYSLPFNLPLFDGRIMSSPPQRGDVIVFKLPLDNRTDYIKRLIGLPGDKIQVKSGILYINGKSVTRTGGGEMTDTDQSGRVMSYKIYRETLPDVLRSHPILEIGDNERLDNTPVFNVPDGHYFFMGDNRDNSQDSRVESMVGFVPFDNLLGHARYVVFSLKDHTPLWQVWLWPFNLRYDRFFTRIE